MSYINQVTAQLGPYPSETLRKMRLQLEAAGKKVYDLSTGDPRIPVWPAIREKVRDSLPDISQYPSVFGSERLRQAHEAYLERRFGLKNTGLILLPTAGSKEAIFHISLSLIQRHGKDRILYPSPGYPVYRDAILFAGGIPTPMELRHEEGFLQQPWNLPAEIVRDTVAIWINYPNNPTGTCATPAYFERIAEWAQTHGIVILSDECYVDIYDTALPADQLPPSMLQITQKGTVAFYSLSKRSGLTGYRAGFIAGDPAILGPHTLARARFGVAQPDFVQEGAVVAWGDDAHVAARREIFSHRVRWMGAALQKMGIQVEIPEATFYLWCKVPATYGEDDVRFCRELAEKGGVLFSPSSWLGGGGPGWFRIACTLDDGESQGALDALAAFCK